MLEDPSNDATVPAPAALVAALPTNDPAALSKSELLVPPVAALARADTPDMLPVTSTFSTCVLSVFLIVSHNDSKNPLPLSNARIRASSQ